MTKYEILCYFDILLIVSTEVSIVLKLQHYLRNFF